MSEQSSPPRVLIVDDNSAIHEDFRKILNPEQASGSKRNAMEKALFGGDDGASAQRVAFRLDFAHQGQEALKKVQEAVAAKDPYAMVFMDVRMPPGWDGIETLEHVWQVAPDLQAVICTAFSDYSWDAITRRLRKSDRLLILKKPFETIEVLQLAHALTNKWELALQAKLRMEDLDRMVNERTQQLVVANDKLREEIAERARMQEALRHSEERFSKAFRASPMSMAILSHPEGRFLDANERFLELTGRTPERLLQHTATGLNLWGGHTGQKLTSIQIGQHIHNHSCSIRRGDESTRDTVLWAEPIALECGPCVLLILEDVTDQLRLEAQLRQAQKMEAVGRLAAGIAHEFNNILTVIQGHAELVRGTSTDTKLVAESGERISKAAQRAAALTRQLLAFSRKQPLQLKPLNLSNIVHATQKMLGQLLGERHEIKFNCAEHLPPTLADEGNLEQILINLSLNARDAMLDGGVISIATSQVTFTEENKPRNSDARTGRFVCLSVSDGGCGIKSEILGRIFDPFFTTKEIGKGTGLGLSTIHGIVRAHHGWIDVASEVGKGTAFNVYFPVSLDVSSASAVAEAAGGDIPRCGHGEGVLVVEDEASVRDLARVTLERGGYVVYEAASGQQAMEVWSRATVPISVLITDMVLPHSLSGGKLAQLLKERNPQLHVICISGYGSEIIKDDMPATISPGVNFLPKPFEPFALLRAVQTSLAGGAEGNDRDNNLVLA